MLHGCIKCLILKCIQSGRVGLVFYKVYSFVNLAGIWKTTTCVKPSDSGVFFTINMGVDKCDITRTGPCSKNLIDDGFLQSLCFGLDDGVTYTCNISSTYTEPVCCLAYAKVNRSLLSTSCFTSKS